MQGSKVKANQVYATSYRGKLERFDVDVVTIVKKGDHASDQTVTVTGRYLDDEARGDATLRADALLGPYKEYTELVAKEAAEKAESERLKQEEEDAHVAVWKRLYELTGLPEPVGKPSRWGGGVDYERTENVFRRSYGGGFEVTKEGAAALVAALERVQRLKAVS